uniref:See1 n=1 Tax=Arundo donax TaxID=35708 RepID=A0A0A9ETP7_ARUDO
MRSRPPRRWRRGRGRRAGGGRGGPSRRRNGQ